MMGAQGTPPYVGLQGRQIARAYAILLPAGAWDAVATLPLVCVGARNLALFAEYEEGAVGGAVDFQVFFSPYALATQVPAGQLEWFSATAKAVGAVVGGATTTSLIQAELNQFDPVGATAEGIILHFEIPGSAERFYVNARESGVVGFPGDCGIIAILTW